MSTNRPGCNGTPAGPAHTAVRVAVGLLFVGHGLRKLSRRVGGTGLTGATAQMQALGLHPARGNAMAAGVTQLTGGALMATGLVTPVGCAMIAANMVIVMRTACAGKGPWSVAGGWEYPLVLAAVSAAIAEQGAGPLSADRRLGLERSGPFYGVACLTTALAGAAAVLSRTVVD